MKKNMTENNHVRKKTGSLKNFRITERHTKVNWKAIEPYIQHTRIYIIHILLMNESKPMGTCTHTHGEKKRERVKKMPWRQTNRYMYTHSQREIKRQKDKISKEALPFFQKLTYKPIRRLKEKL